MVTKPYEFIEKTAIHGCEHCEIVEKIAIHGTKPYEFIGKIGIHGPKPYFVNISYFVQASKVGRIKRFAMMCKGSSLGRKVS